MFSLVAGQDYRQHSTELEAWGDYCWPEPDDGGALIRRTLGLGEGAALDPVLEVNHHPLRVHALEGDRAWLDFHELFATPRSASDYLWLIEHFPHMAVSGLDRLGDHPQDVSQRFLNFIDIAYDRGLHLRLFSAVALEQLAEGGNAVDFARTLSRMKQLRSVKLDTAH